MPSVNIYQTQLLPYTHSNSQLLSLRLNCSLVSVLRRSCGSLVQVLVCTCGNCSSQTEWTVHVGRRCHRGRLITIANEQQWCVHKCT